MIIQAVVYFAVKSAKQEEENKEPSTGILIVLYIVGGLMALLTLTLMGFCLFHLFLQCRNKTTREFVKKIDNARNYQTSGQPVPVECKNYENDWVGVSSSFVKFNHKLTADDVKRIETSP